MFAIYKKLTIQVTNATFKVILWNFKHCEIGQQLWEKDIKLRKLWKQSQQWDYGPYFNDLKQVHSGRVRIHFS